MALDIDATEEAFSSTAPRDALGTRLVEEDSDVGVVVAVVEVVAVDEVVSASSWTSPAPEDAFDEEDDDGGTSVATVTFVDVVLAAELEIDCVFSLQEESTFIEATTDCCTSEDDEPLVTAEPVVGVLLVLLVLELSSS